MNDLRAASSTETIKILSDDDLDSTIPCVDDKVAEFSPARTCRFVVNWDERASRSESESEADETPGELFTHKYIPDGEPAPFSTSFHETEDEEEEGEEERTRRLQERGPPTTNHLVTWRAKTREVMITRQLHSTGSHSANRKMLTTERKTLNADRGIRQLRNVYLVTKGQLKKRHQILRRRIIRKGHKDKNHTKLFRLNAFADDCKTPIEEVPIEDESEYRPESFENRRLTL